MNEQGRDFHIVLSWYLFPDLKKNAYFVSPIAYVLEVAKDDKRAFPWVGK